MGNGEWGMGLGFQRKNYARAVTPDIFIHNYPLPSPETGFFPPRTFDLVGDCSPQPIDCIFTYPTTSISPLQQFCVPNIQESGFHSALTNRG